MYVNRKRRRDREAAANSRTETEDGGGTVLIAAELDEVTPAQMPDRINNDDEEERRLHCVRTRSEPKKDEFI